MEGVAGHPQATSAFRLGEGSNCFGRGDGIAFNMDHQEFARLTRQEERANLLNATDIGRRHGWEQLLTEHGYQLRGHRLVRI